MIGWLIAYGVVAVAVAVAGAIGMVDPVGEGDKRLGARILLGSPVWPLLLIQTLLKLVAEAKATLAEKDES